MSKTSKEKIHTPFFARFLEKQDRKEETSVRVQSGVKSGCGPFDPPKKGVVYTCKYPSDGDEGGPLI